MTPPVPYPRALLLLAALLYALFVVYGSLVPLQYRAVPLEQALASFRAIPYLDLGIGSRADWVANILLFVPLAFIWLGVLWHRSSAALRSLASLLVLVTAAGLSVAIEFTQLFFPPRTVSQNDVLAELIGAATGVVAWWAFGPRLVRWLAAWRAGTSEWSPAQTWLAIYLAAMFGYNLLPLDLTISPVEVFHKLQEGRLVLVPFGGLPDDMAQAAYDLLTDVAIWVPAGLLWRRVSGSAPRALRNTILVALLLEFLQLWVYSRVSDVTDLLTAALGGWLGGRFGARGGDQHEPLDAHAGALVRAMLYLGCVAAWAGVLMGVFWYPFDFRMDGAFLRERIELLERAPFTAYYYGTEFRAATEVLHKVLFFAPLGFLAGFAMVRFRWPRAVVWLLGLSVAGGMGAVIEVGQLALPGKNADVTDWVLETLGGALGVWISLTMFGKTTKRAPAGRALPRRAPVQVATGRRAMPSRSEDPPPPRSG